MSALNALPSLKDKNITASAISNNLEDNTSHNITFSARAGRVSDELGKLTLMGNGIPKVNSTSITTYGIDGWTTGSNYEISVYCWKYCKFIVGKDGSLDVEEL